MATGCDRLRPLGSQTSSASCRRDARRFARSGPRTTSASFRRREWGPAVTASNVAKPARIYDLRATFASNALAAGVTLFELARVMGTSVRMIERHYGALLDGAHAGIAARLDALDQATEAEGCG